MRANSSSTQPMAGSWRRRAAAWTTGVAGALAVVAQLGIGGASLIAGDDVAPPFSGPFERLLAVFGGLAMLWLARGMARGRRRAADAAIAVLGALAVVRWLNGQGPWDVGLDLAAAALLCLSRDAFPAAATSRIGRLPGTLALTAGAAAYVLHETVQLDREGVTDVDRAVSAVGHAGGGLASGAWWLAPTGTVPIALDALVAVALVAAALWLYALVRPHRASGGHPPEEHARAAQIVAHHGEDSLDPFALREDKSFHFAAGGFLAYRTLRHTAVVAGDPVGPPGAAPEILRSFLAFAAERGWEVVVTGASARHLDAGRALGLRAISIGREAVVHPAAFSLEGRGIRKVRQSVTRVRRQGWQVELVPGERLTPALVAELGELEGQWRARQRRLHGFAMTLGRLWGAEEDQRSLYVVARDSGGELRAFLRFATFLRGLSLDVMRGSEHQPNGLNEAMIVVALEHARERGIAEVSLNFAGFAHIMAADAALTRGQRVLRWWLRRAHGRFQLERLARFNAKFSPDWRPRYLLFTSRSRLPVVALRVLQAEAYVKPPRTSPLSARWQPLPASPGSASGEPATS